MPECPADGCEYNGEIESVAGHYGGKQDTEHAGSYQTAMNILQTNDSNINSGGSQNEDPEPDGGSNELDFPENPDATDDPEPETEPSRSRCPECGSGNYASSDLSLQNISGLSEKAKRALQEHEYHCHDCGEVFNL